MADYEPIEQTRRYVLGETDSFYGVWDAQAGSEPLEEFPLTQEGFEGAEARFRELKRADRRERGVLTKALWIAMFVGAVAWILSGLVIVLLGVVIDIDTPIISNVAFWLDALGFRLFVSSLALILGWVLLRRRSPHIAMIGSGEQQVAGVRLRRWEGSLEKVLIVALAVWILTSIWTNLFFRPPFAFDSTQDPAWRVASTIDSVALRTWVASVVLLAISWAQRRPQGSPSFSGDQ